MVSSRPEDSPRICRESELTSNARPISVRSSHSVSSSIENCSNGLSLATVVAPAHASWSGLEIRGSTSKNGDSRSVKVSRMSFSGRTSRLMLEMGTHGFAQLFHIPGHLLVDRQSSRGRKLLPRDVVAMQCIAADQRLRGKTDAHVSGERESNRFVDHRHEDVGEGLFDQEIGEIACGLENRYDSQKRG